MSPLEEAVRAAQLRSAALHEAQHQQDVMHAAWRRTYQAGVTAPTIAEYMRGELGRLGWSEAELDGAGFSLARVRGIVGRRG